MLSNIEAERSRKQMTKEELSKTLGISSRTYKSYLQGKTAIPSNVLLKMAEIFCCTTDYLLGIDDNSPPKAAGKHLV